MGLTLDPSWAKPPASAVSPHGAWTQALCVTQECQLACCCSLEASISPHLSLGSPLWHALESDYSPVEGGFCLELIDPHFPEADSSLWPFQRDALPSPPGVPEGQTLL